MCADGHNGTSLLQYRRNIDVFQDSGLSIRPVGWSDLIVVKGGCCFDAKEVISPGFVLQIEETARTENSRPSGVVHAAGFTVHGSARKKSKWNASVLPAYPGREKNCERNRLQRHLR
jgi:hypothetical protein